MRWRLSSSSPGTLLTGPMRAIRPHVLVRRTGLDAYGDTGSLWRILPTVRMLFVFLSRLAGWSYLAPRCFRASHACGGVAPPLPPAGYSVDPSPGDLGATLVGRRILYWWPSDGWQLGTVARICAPSASGFTHVVAYTRQTSVVSGTVDTLLDATSYGQRWVLLSPLAPAGVTRVPRRNRVLASEA